MQCLLPKFARLYFNSIHHTYSFFNILVYLFKFFHDFGVCDDFDTFDDFRVCADFDAFHDFVDCADFDAFA